MASSLRSALGLTPATARQRCRFGPPPPAARHCSPALTPPLTLCLRFNAAQAALDYSPAHTIWVRNVSGLPWVVRPIFLRSNKTVRFAAGTLVVAKRGEFHAKNASLFNVGYSYHYVATAAECPVKLCGPQKCCMYGAVENVSLVGERGATFRMWRGDYANLTMYSKSEFRHGVYVCGGSQHIRIEGLRIELTGTYSTLRLHHTTYNSVGLLLLQVIVRMVAPAHTEFGSLPRAWYFSAGGDGICLGAGYPAVDVLVRNVTCDRNYRQGMSIVNGEHGMSMSMSPRLATEAACHVEINRICGLC